MFFDQKGVSFLPFARKRYVIYSLFIREERLRNGKAFYENSRIILEGNVIDEHNWNNPSPLFFFLCPKSRNFDYGKHRFYNRKLEIFYRFVNIG